MRWSFVQRETWGYRKLIQRRFWKPSGILDHHFAILDPGISRWTSLIGKDGKEMAIPESAYCVHCQADIFTMVLIPKRDFPDLSEAVLLMRKAQLTGPRVARYMAVYHAYETVVSKRDPAFSAIRHAMSHAQSALTRKSTVDELVRIFGSTHIQFGEYSHLREFNLQLGRLLIATDTALGCALAEQPGLIRSAPMTAEDLDAA